MTLLAIIQVVSGFQSLLSSLIYFALVPWTKTPEGVAALTKAGAWALKNAGGVFLVLAIVYLVIGLSALILARGYLNAKEWARHRGRLLAALAILFAFIGGIFLPERLDPGSPLWTIIFNAIVIVYLGRAKVRRFFS